MKVSDDDMATIGRHLVRLEGGVSGQQLRRGPVAMFSEMRHELLALREVADAASKLVDEINTADFIDDVPDSVEYADVLEALAEAGR